MVVNFLFPASGYLYFTQHKNVQCFFYEPNTIAAIKHTCVALLYVRNISQHGAVTFNIAQNYHAQSISILFIGHLSFAHLSLSQSLMQGKLQFTGNAIYFR